MPVYGDGRGEAVEGLVARRSRTGTKTDTPLNEIPQTINVVTAQQLEMTGATDINQALRYIRLLQLWLGKPLGLVFGAARFHPTAYVDGLQVPKTLNLASWRVEPYTIDSITVLRGPTSVLYGQGDPGAIVDVQSKLANGDRIREIEVQVGNYARKQLAFDIGDTANSDGTLSYRLIGVGRDGNSQTGPNKDGRIAFPVAALAAQRGDVADAVGHLPGRPQRHRQQLPAGPGHGAAQSQRPHLARCTPASRTSTTTARSSGRWAMPSSTSPTRPGRCARTCA